MIDKVRMYKSIKLDTDKFDERGFKYGIYRVKETNEDIPYYRYNYKRVDIFYYPKTFTLRINGKLINLASEPNKVDTLDKLLIGTSGTITYEKDPKEEYTIMDYDIDDQLIIQYNESTFETDDYIEDIDDILDRLNSKLFELTKVKFDVRNFIISYIEICFNIETPYVNQYVDLFNRIFISRKLKRYKNFIIEEEKQPFTSCYIKTKGDYEKKGKPQTNYVVNFYNKANQLTYLLEQNRTKEKHKRTNISAGDLSLAENVLRLEIQCKYHYLNTFCKKRGIDRTFGNFIDIDLCSEVIKDKYKPFFDKELYGTFYDYRSVKSKIQESDFTDKEKSWLLKYLEKHSKGYSMSETTFRKFKKMLASMGIHYTLIPTKWNIEMLESPIKLLDNRVNELKEMRKEYLSILSDYMEEVEEEVINDISNEELLRILMEGID